MESSNINNAALPSWHPSSALFCGKNESFEQGKTSLKDQMPLPEPHLVSKRRALDSNMDPKKLRKIMASRQYSQKYRLKQLHYITQLETELKALQAEVEISYPRIKYANRQNSLLQMENNRIKKMLTAISNEMMFKQAQYEELKKEKDGYLKQICTATHLQHQQQQRKPAAAASAGGAGAGNYGYRYGKMNLNQLPRFSPARFMEPAAATTSRPQAAVMDRRNHHQFGNNIGGQNNFFALNNYSFNN